jgi:hypothetical protein
MKSSWLRYQVPDLQVVADLVPVGLQGSFEQPITVEGASPPSRSSPVPTSRLTSDPPQSNNDGEQSAHGASSSGGDSNGDASDSGDGSSDSDHVSQLFAAASANPTSGTATKESPVAIRPHRNVLLDTAAYDALDPTIVPWDEWIPGYHGRVAYSEEDVAPWNTSAFSQVSILELNVELLFHDFAQPSAWIFPAEGEPPTPHLWYPELITEANVIQLLKTEPWTVLDTQITPVSFDHSGWFAWIALKYVDLEEEHKQSFWESAHAFPIDSVLRKQDPYMAEFGRQRKQRRSRLGAR